MKSNATELKVTNKKTNHLNEQISQVRDVRDQAKQKTKGAAVSIVKVKSEMKNEVVTLSITLEANQ